MLAALLTLTADDRCAALLEQLYLLYRRQMIYVAMRILKDQGLAEDAVHDAFLSLIPHLAKITDPASSQTRRYMIFTAHNRAIDYYRKRKQLAEDDYADFEPVCSDKMNPEQYVLNRERIDRLAQRMAQMQPAYAEILVYRYALDYSDQEIARRFNLSPAAVRQRLSRARRQLHQMLQEEGDLHA